MKMDLSKQLEVAKEIAIKAGEEILKIYNSYNPDEENSLEIKEKEEDSYKSPLTKADLIANKIIVDKLREEFPEYGVLTEEEVDNKERLQKEFVWIIDPLDGTKEFIKKNGEFTVNIALVFENKPIMGVIFVPVKNELYYASNCGAFYEKLYSEKGSVEIHVSNKNNTEDMVFVKSRSHASEKLVSFLENVKFEEIISSGSSIKGCLVANGNADVYLRLGPINEWDICAMEAIIKGSGGEITDLEGKDLKYNKEFTLFKHGFLVSNKVIHEKLLSEVKNIV
jgi:3'(2'), 5'-bisphosphate nucleotidase